MLKCLDHHLGIHLHHRDKEMGEIEPAFGIDDPDNPEIQEGYRPIP